VWWLQFPPSGWMSMTLPSSEGIGTLSLTHTFLLLTTVPLASQLGAGVTTFGILLSPGQCCVNALAGWITYCISFDISGRQMRVE
jgi:hypothetical protein